MSEFTNESVLSIETTLRGVEHALERLREGTYRRCEVCSSPIEESDLEADPLTATCRAHLDLSAS